MAPTPCGWVVILLLVSAALLLAGCGLDSPMTTVEPKSDLGRAIHDLFMNISGWALLIFVVVEALLIGVVFAFRDRPGREEPRAVHGHLGLEIAWTLVPVIIVVSIAVPTIATIFKTNAPPPREALAIEVTGHQWWWEVRYPELGIVTANEIHLPVGRAVSLSLKTADVLHSFWVPRLGGKRDLIGGKLNNLTFTADVPGEYPGQCAEFCGVSHANMRLLVVAQSTSDFEAWAARLKTPPARPAGEAAKGHQAFLAGGCVACHAIQGVAAGVLGPDLTHVGGRKTLAAGILKNTPDDLARWLRDPPGAKPGALMPKLPLTEDQVTALVAYLRSLR
ncbi:MAG: cytochrome c oxidase subunit II [Candidatus Rokubacteria bacterium]|nr:cytochrome c oxidase subunit II [Candidatus Rokubacteria bacterium]